MFSAKPAVGTDPPLRNRTSSRKYTGNLFTPAGLAPLPPAKITPRAGIIAQVQRTNRTCAFYPTSPQKARGRRRHHNSKNKIEL